MATFGRQILPLHSSAFLQRRLPSDAALSALTQPESFSAIFRASRCSCIACSRWACLRALRRFLALSSARYVMTTVMLTSDDWLWRWRAGCLSSGCRRAAALHVTPKPTTLWFPHFGGTIPSMLKSLPICSVWLPASCWWLKNTVGILFCKYSRYLFWWNNDKQMNTKDIYFFGVCLFSAFYAGYVKWIPIAIAAGIMG